MLGGNSTTQTENIKYALQSKEKSTYTNLINELETLKSNHKAKTLQKQLFRMRLGAISPEIELDEPYGLPYPEHNAQTTGDFRYQENLKNVCGQNVIWFQGVSSGDYYLKELSCRKQWCPTCGGAGGTIHKSRLHSVMQRVDVKKYNLRQIIFTIPERMRLQFRSKKALNDLFKMSRAVVEKTFGQPELDKYGHVKRYKMQSGCISYLHLFGDQEAGILKPHINIHIVENKMELMKISSECLKKLREEWAKQLRKYDLSFQDDESNVYYQYRIGERKVMHSIKYMLRPWSAEHYEAIGDDEELKKLLVLELNGFQYFRYWGKLANCVYKDNMDVSEIREESENKTGEQLIHLFIAPFDILVWGANLEKIDDGLYRIKKGLNNETKKNKTNETGGTN